MMESPTFSMAVAFGAFTLAAPRDRRMFHSIDRPAGADGRPANALLNYPRSDRRSGP